MNRGEHPAARPLVFVTAVLVLATLSAYAGRWSWACELLVTFRTHFAMALGLAVLWASLVRHWRIAGLAALGVAFNLGAMSSAFENASDRKTGDARPVRLVAFNVHVRNADLSGVAAYLETLAPDVAVFEEVTLHSADRLSQLLPRLSHRVQAVDEGRRGVLILSRWPLTAAEALRHESRMFGMRVDVELGDRALRLYGVHLNWPLLPRAAEGRRAQMAMLGRELAACAGACVIAGDFNTSSWSSHFRALQESSGFHDCAKGRGFLPTWPAALPAPLRIRIDHCLANEAVVIDDVRVGARAGSDHLVTINDLRVEAPAKVRGATAP